jgi:hypothetical protein
MSKSALKAMKPLDCCGMLSKVKRQGGFSADSVPCWNFNNPTEHKQKLSDLRGQPKPLVTNCKATKMTRKAFYVVSLLVALLHPNGGEGMNINTNINVPVTVIHSN